MARVPRVFYLRRIQGKALDSQHRPPSPSITFPGPSRGTRARSRQQILVHLCPAPISSVRQRRHAVASIDTRLSRQARDTLDCRGWHQSLGYYVRRQCGRCACPCCAKLALLENCCGRGILHSEQRADRVPRLLSRNLEEFRTCTLCILPVAESGLATSSSVTFFGIAASDHGLLSGECIQMIGFAQR
jgi:hypothetical protein